MDASGNPVEHRTSAPKRRRLAEVAKALEATILRGDPDMELTDFATLGSAGPTDISFVANQKALALAEKSRAGAFAAPEPMDLPGRPVLRVPEIWEAVCRLVGIFRPAPPVASGIDPTARIGEGVDLGPGAALGPNAVVGNGAAIGRATVIGAGSTIGDGARIGHSCLIYPGVHILHNVQIGDRVIIHSGAVIGSDGFKFELVGGRPKKIPQAGTVIIEDDVEIGANCTIDRAFLDATRIGAGAKLDNLVHIAHNVQIGRGCMLAGQVGIAGSTVLGDGCILAGQVGVRDNIRIGNGVQFGAKAGVKDDAPDGAVLLGIPARPIAEFLRVQAALRRTPDLLKRVRQLEKRLEQLEGGGQKA